MIKKFIDKLLGKTDSAAASGKARFGKREEVPFDGHRIDPALVDERALNVVTTLQKAGYDAYIVGGAVRDLLLGLKPKDFDVATSATPEQVKSLFRRAFIIGRRFRIVHVVFGRGRDHEVIEVSTFRAYMDSLPANQVAGNERTSRSELAGLHHAVDASGRVLRDNVWGPQEEDAARRDFSINAMYYDPARQVVVDYHNGIKDAKKLKLRMIGDPATRYREDPVRVIRGIRFSAKLAALGFKLEPKTLAPLIASSKLLADVPQSRLFDEMLKLLQTGHAVATIAQLRALGLATGIYPLLDVVVERADSTFVKAALTDTDRRVQEGKPVAPSFLLACVLWSDVRDGWTERQQARDGRRGMPSYPALQDAIDAAFEARIGDVSGRGKLAADMREIWMMQPRFEKRSGATPYSLAEQPRFRAAFDFMRLRADIGEFDEAIAQWWQEFSTAGDARRHDLMEQVRDEQQRGQRTRTRAPARSAEELGTEPAARGSADRASVDDRGVSIASGAPDDSLVQADSVPRKRRRRRKPRGEGSSGAPSGEQAAPPDSAHGRPSDDVA